MKPRVNQLKKQSKKGFKSASTSHVSGSRDDDETFYRVYDQIDIFGRSKSIPRVGLKNSTYSVAWVCDNASTVCMSCLASFTCLKRRHHCRCCGFLVCNDCSNSKIKLEILDERKSRICKTCLKNVISATQASCKGNFGIHCSMSIEEQKIIPAAVAHYASPIHSTELGDKTNSNSTVLSDNDRLDVVLIKHPDMKTRTSYSLPSNVIKFIATPESENSSNSDGVNGAVPSAIDKQSSSSADRIGNSSESALIYDTAVQSGVWESGSVTPGSSNANSPVKVVRYSSASNSFGRQFSIPSISNKVIESESFKDSSNSLYSPLLANAGDDNSSSIVANSHSELFAALTAESIEQLTSTMNPHKSLDRDLSSNARSMDTINVLDLVKSDFTISRAIRRSGVWDAPDNDNASEIESSVYSSKPNTPLKRNITPKGNIVDKAVSTRTKNCHSNKSTVSNTVHSIKSSQSTVRCVVDQQSSAVDKEQLSSMSGKNIIMSDIDQENIINESATTSGSIIAADIM